MGAQSIRNSPGWRLGSIVFLTSLIIHLGKCSLMEMRSMIALGLLMLEVWPQTLNGWKHLRRTTRLMGQLVLRPLGRDPNVGDDLQEAHAIASAAY